MIDLPAEPPGACWNFERSKVAVTVVDVRVVGDVLVVEGVGDVTCGAICGRVEVGSGVQARDVEATDGKLRLREGVIDTT